MEKTLIPLNWTVGTLLLVIAVTYPTLDEKFFTGGKKLEVQAKVAHLAKLQTRHYQSNEQYVLFTAEEIPETLRSELGLKGPPQDDFVYDAFLAGNGQLVLRAQASPESIRNGSLPPLTYTLRQSAGGQVGEGTWEPLSGKKPGLF
ncbi:MAG: hypothetical protein HW380_321 [Magnetococcales bacterium]|nr:hypothetical protein [Magnetococcales bacterium]